MTKLIMILIYIIGVILSGSLSFAEEKSADKKGIVETIAGGMTNVLTDPLFIKSIAKGREKPAIKTAAPAKKTVEAKPAASSGIKAPAPGAEAPAKRKRSFTKEELVEHMKETLDDEEEILGLVQGLKKMTTEKGESFYTYNGTRLEDMDREKLDIIFSKVNQHLARIRAERLNKQLENIRSSQQITDAARSQAKIPAVPAQPPRVYTPPRAHAVPPSVQQAPRIPAPPPAPPRR